MSSNRQWYILWFGWAMIFCMRDKGRGTRDERPANTDQITSEQWPAQQDHNNQRTHVLPHTHTHKHYLYTTLIYNHVNNLVSLVFNLWINLKPHNNHWFILLVFIYVKIKLDLNADFQWSSCKMSFFQIRLYIISSFYRRL